MFGEDGVREYLTSKGQELYSVLDNGTSDFYENMVKRKNDWLASGNKGAALGKKLKLDEPDVILTTLLGAFCGELLASSLDYEASGPYSIAVPVIFGAGGAVAGYLLARCSIGLGQGASSLIYGNGEKP